MKPALSPSLIRALLWIIAFNLIPAPSLRPAWAAALAAVLMIYRLWLDWTNRPTLPAPARVVSQLAVGALTWWHYGSFLGDEAAGTLLTLLVVVKSFELKTPRDLFINFCLCLLTLMSYLLLDQSLLLTLFTVIDVVLLTAFLFALGEGRLVWRGMRKSIAPSLGAALKAAPLVIMIFILFPRFSTGFGQGEAGAGKIGVTDSLRPGSVSGLIGSNELVFRATFLNGAVPARSTLYWRGAVLSEGDGLNWDRPKAEAGRHGAAVVDAGGNPQVEIYLEPGFEKFLYVLEEAGAPVFPNEAIQRGLNPRGGGTFELPQALRTRERYNLFTNDDAGANDHGDDPALFLKTPRPPSARMLAYLKTHGGRDAGEIARALLAGFKTDYAYTLTPPPAKTIDDFMFETRAGFCEHYAGALATMMRYQNVPARVVVGFQGGTPSFLENYLTVRGNDAHAWVEYYNARAGRWLAVDPTAQVDPLRISVGATIYAGRDGGWWSGDWSRQFLRSRAVFDEVDAAWTGFLLRFDLARQRELLAAVGMEGVLFRALPVFLVLAIALITAILYFIETRRRAPLPPAERLWRLLLAILKRRWRVEKSPSETPLAFLERLKFEHPHLTPRLDAAFVATLRVRFAPDATKDDFARARAEVRRLGKIPRG